MVYVPPLSNSQTGTNSPNNSYSSISKQPDARPCLPTVSVPQSTALTTEDPRGWPASFTSPPQAASFRPILNGLNAQLPQWTAQRDTAPAWPSHHGIFTPFIHDRAERKGFGSNFAQNEHDTRSVSVSSLVDTSSDVNVRQPAFLISPDRTSNPAENYRSNPAMKRPKSQHSGQSTPTAVRPREVELPQSYYHNAGPAEMPCQDRVRGNSRWKLHLRQQPRAARAGPDGKDRRTIDPPPVLQLLIDDFDIEADLHFLTATDWVVYARLMSADGKEDMMIQQVQGEPGEGHGIVRLLLGAHVASPLYCESDPHSESAVRHPVTRPPPPASPSIRFIAGTNRGSQDSDAYKKYPGTFFIFPDMSVRRAGQYRLYFRLMKMGEAASKGPGTTVPTISEVMSDVFNVVNAKDFDQVQPSTPLIRGLVAHGAGYPLKLKKGFREGQKRRLPAEGTTDDEDDEGD